MSEVLHREKTPLGWTVEIGRAQWKRISTIKHRSMAGREADVRQVLREPKIVRQSRKDDDVYLFYRGERPGRWICAVAKRVDEETGFLITAYVTDAIKQGELIWPR